MNQNRRVESTIWVTLGLLTAAVFAPQALWFLQSTALGSGPDADIAVYVLLILGGLWMFAAGSMVQRAIEGRGARKARQLEQSEQQAAEALATPLGLSIERDIGLGHCVLVGRHQGIWLRVNLTDTPYLICSHRLPLPAGLKIRAGTGGEPLDSPVLASVLCAENVGDLDLSAPGLAGPLLEVLHGHFGSVLGAHTLTVRSLNLRQLASEIDLVIELCAQLKEICR